MKEKVSLFFIDNEKEKIGEMAEFGASNVIIFFSHCNIAENDEFRLVPPKHISIDSVTTSKPLENTIDEERQLRLWKYMKTFREMVLTYND
jgi:hypothetical protein